MEKFQWKEDQIPITDTKKIPKSFEKIHNGKSGSDLEANKTLSKVREGFYWMNCYEDIKARCDTFAANKRPKTRAWQEMKKYNV